MSRSLTSFGQTDVGLKRQKNEDSYLIDDGLGLFIVADGMGGHKGGEMASRMAVEMLKDIVELGRKKDTDFNAGETLRLGYREACKAIYTHSHVTDPDLQGMGTTMVSALLHNNVLYIGNVGDSRAYLVRDGMMWQLTEDHSLLNEHIRAGLIRDNEIEHFQAKNVITRSVGFEDDVDCDILFKAVQPGDRYVLCSDGLSGPVKPEELLNICRLNNLNKAVGMCIEEAKKGGGDDNITVLMIDIL